MEIDLCIEEPEVQLSGKFRVGLVDSLPEGVSLLLANDLVRKQNLVLVPDLEAEQLLDECLPQSLADKAQGVADNIHDSAINDQHFHNAGFCEI